MNLNSLHQDRIDTLYAIHQRKLKAGESVSADEVDAAFLAYVNAQIALAQWHELQDAIERFLLKVR